MNLKETLDKITEILRCIQHANQTKEELIATLQNLLILVGQIVVQRDTANQELYRFNNQLWISHILGQIECPECASPIPLDFYVGSKGVDGSPVSAANKDKLIELLEFPPITRDDLARNPIPDYMPEL